jgi:hypothetical protein
MHRKKKKNNDQYYLIKSIISNAENPGKPPGFFLFYWLFAASFLLPVASQ